MLEKIKETATSRKFWAMITGTVLAYYGVDPMVIAVIGSYILGQGIADAAKAKS